MATLRNAMGEERECPFWDNPKANWIERGHAALHVQDDLIGNLCRYVSAFRTVGNDKMADTLAHLAQAMEDVHDVLRDCLTASLNQSLRYTQDMTGSILTAMLHKGETERDCGGEA